MMRSQRSTNQKMKMARCNGTENMDYLRNATEYTRRHLSPVIAESGGVLFARKGTRSVRLSERVVHDAAATKLLVRRYVDQLN